MSDNQTKDTLTVSHKVETDIALVDDPTGDETGQPSLWGEVEKWCSEQITMPYRFWVDEYCAFYYMIFWNVSDATRFRLKWR